MVRIRYLLLIGVLALASALSESMFFLMLIAGACYLFTAPVPADQFRILRSTVNAGALITVWSCFRYLLGNATLTWPPLMPTVLVGLTLLAFLIRFVVNMLPPVLTRKRRTAGNRRSPFIGSPQRGDGGSHFHTGAGSPRTAPGMTTQPHRSWAGSSGFWGVGAGIATAYGLMGNRLGTGLSEDDLDTDPSSSSHADSDWATASTSTSTPESDATVSDVDDPMDVGGIGLMEADIINPATGLLMLGAFDTDGNPYGFSGNGDSDFDSNSSFDDDGFGSSDW